MTAPRTLPLGALALSLTLATPILHAAPSDEGERTSSYNPVKITEPFDSIMQRMKDAKPSILKKHQALLEQRYDLSDRPAASLQMTRGKPIQEGVRVKLPAETNWAELAAMSPEDIRAKGLFPAGFMPLPHPNHPEGGMVFPQFHIDEVNRIEGRDLTRFDLDFDLPDHFLPEFPAPIFLTTRPDLGDVSRASWSTSATTSSCSTASSIPSSWRACGCW